MGSWFFTCWFFLNVLGKPIMDYYIKTHVSHEDVYVLPNILCAEIILIEYEHSSWVLPFHVPLMSTVNWRTVSISLTLVKEKQALENGIPLWRKLWNSWLPVQTVICLSKKGDKTNLNSGLMISSSQVLPWLCRVKDVATDQQVACEKTAHFDLGLIS